MSMTIFKLTLIASLPNSVLHKIVEKNTDSNNVADSQAIYDQIKHLHGWTSPEPSNDQIGIENYEHVGIVYDGSWAEGKKQGMNIKDDGNEIKIFIFDIPLQRTSPEDVILEMQSFEKDIRSSIEDNVRDLIFKNGRKGKLLIKEDLYHGYPSVYSQNAHCSICELKGAYVKNDGKVSFIVGPLDKHNNPSNPFNVKPISELLQVWSILREHA